MGILVETSFDTPQGFSVSGVYVRIARVTPINAAQIMVYIEAFLSREKYLADSKPVSVPGMPLWTSFPSPNPDLTRLDIIYPYVHRDLEFRGFVCTPVLEPTPAPEPAPEA